MKLVLQTHQQPIRGRNYQGALLRSLGLPATLTSNSIPHTLAGEEDHLTGIREQFSFFVLTHDLDLLMRS